MQSLAAGRSIILHKVAGADLRVVMLDTRDPIDLQPLLPWIRATAENVAAAYGRFPNPDASILLIPAGGQAWRSDSAVSFGRLVRDGGETIELMIKEYNDGKDKDEELRRVVVVALGRIGTVPAANALSDFAGKAPKGLRNVVIDAHLHAAESLCRAGKHTGSLPACC